MHVPLDILFQPAWLQKRFLFRELTE